MAKAQPLLAVDLNGTLGDNAPQILYTRFSEMLSYAIFVTDPTRIVELHSMRICAKRLRYTLEVFAPAYNADADAYNQLTEEIKAIQEQLGEIHDCDVRISLINDYLNQHLAKKPEIRLGLQSLIDRQRTKRAELYDAFAAHWLIKSSERKLERDFVRTIFNVRLGSLSNR